MFKARRISCLYKYSMRIHKRVYAYSTHILSPRITNGAHLDTI